jgi:O-glycosyl hydrolase
MPPLRGSTAIDGVRWPDDRAKNADNSTREIEVQPTGGPQVKPSQALSLALVVASGLSAGPAARAQTVVAVDLDRRHQTIEGFGTCLISWEPEMERLYATAAFQDAYIRQLGASMVRINLWGPCLPGPVADWHDIRYERFTMTGDGDRVRMFLTAAKELQRADPQLRFLGTVWSPPAWMKENKSIVDKSEGAIDGTRYVNKGRMYDNRVRKEYYPHFVKWLVEMAKLHKAQGVPLYAISPGNEVMFTQRFESCVWDAEDYARIVGMLGDGLEQEGLGSVLVFGPETMTSHNWGRGIANDAYVQAIAGDAKATKYLGRWATHGYVDGFTTDTSKDSARAFWNMIKGTQKPFWITEGGTGSHEWPAALRGLGAMLHNALVDGNASAFLPWQATEFKASEHALMVGDQLTGKSRAAQHYFKYIRPGAVRVETSPASGAIPTSAFVHDADNTLTIVLANPAREPRQVTLALAGEQKLREMEVRRTSATEQFALVEPVAVHDGRIDLAMPAESLVTLHGHPLH